MSQNVVYLHEPSPIGHYLRVGSSGHRQLETLHGAGRLSIDRIVVEASMAAKQRDLMAALAESGAELILDTNVAELSSVGRFSGFAKGAPWANPEAVLVADDLLPAANRDFSCNDPRCCPRGLDDTLKDPKAHYLCQRQLQVNGLARVSELRRAQHFLDRQLSPARQRAQLAAKLDIRDEELASMLAKNGERLEKTQSVLTDLHGTLSGGSRSSPALRRRNPAGNQTRRGGEP